MKCGWILTTTLTMMEKVMALNNVQAVGDDQQWKTEVERTIRELQRQVEILKAQLNARGTR